MENKLVREMTFGKSKVIITVKYYKESQNDEIKNSTDFVIIDKNGEKVGSSHLVFLHSYNKIAELGADEGKKAYDTINAEIDEMHDTLCRELGILTDEEKRVQRAIIWAKDMIKKCEDFGVDMLMTESVAKKWRDRYKNNSDGVELISKHEMPSKKNYERALKILGC